MRKIIRLLVEYAQMRKNPRLYRNNTFTCRFSYHSSFHRIKWEGEDVIKKVTQSKMSYVRRELLGIQLKLIYLLMTLKKIRLKYKITSLPLGITCLWGDRSEIKLIQNWRIERDLCSFQGFGRSVSLGRP